MADSTSPTPDKADDAVRARVVMLLAWAEDELDLLSSAFRGCTEDELEALRAAQGVSHLPVAYREFMHRMGGGGVGSAIAEMFPGDDIAFDSIVPADDWVGAKALAAEIVEEHGVDFPLDDRYVVIRTHRTSEMDCVTLDGADPPVFSVHDSNGPTRSFERFTDWLEFRIGRAIKRRYPLRDSHLHPVEPGRDAACLDDEGEDWFAVLAEEQGESAESGQA